MATILQQNVMHTKYTWQRTSIFLFSSWNVMKPKDQLNFSISFTFNSLEKWNWILFEFHQVQFEYSNDEWIYKKPSWIKCKCNWNKSDNNKNEMFTSKTAMLLEFKTKRFLQIVVVLKVTNEKKIEKNTILVAQSHIQTVWQSV